MHRDRKWLKAGRCASSSRSRPRTAGRHKSASGPLARLPKVELASSSDTLPSTTSAASIYLWNWQDMQAIWMAPTLNQAQTATYGPRIAELHYSGNWAVNQIVDYTGFFRDETDGVKYDQAQDFTTTGYLDQNGVLHGDYGTYNGSPTPIQMSRDFVMVPNEPFMVVRYTLTNPSATTSYKWNVLDQVHLNNTNTSDNVTGSYSSGTDTLYADMTASGQYVVFLGAMQTPGSYQVGNDSDCTASDTTASAWCQFDANGTLADNSSLATPNMDLGFQNEVTIAPNSTQTLYYYLGIAPTMSAAEADVGTASGESGPYWYAQTGTDYSNWLDAGKTVSTTDSGVNTAYLRNLVVIKNSQNPGDGLFPATTNPGSYSYKAWVRDSSFDAMALDAAGHYSEAQQYWDWMAANQGSNGTWETTYDLWTGAYISFVQPEYDSIGEFLNRNSMHSVETLISDVHNHAAVAMNYNLIYGAWSASGQDGSGANYQWGPWWDNNCTNQANFSLPAGFATSNIYFFDPGNSSWQGYIFGREKDAEDVYPFDGWQMDQLGTLVGNPVYTCSGVAVTPTSEFSGFITNAYNALGGDIVFNAPGQYGQQQVAANPDLTFLYTECWPSNGQTTCRRRSTTTRLGATVPSPRCLPRTQTRPMPTTTQRQTRASSTRPVFSTKMPRSSLREATTLSSAMSTICWTPRTT